MTNKGGTSICSCLGVEVEVSLNSLTASKGQVRTIGLSFTRVNNCRVVSRYRAGHEEEEDGTERSRRRSCGVSRQRDDQTHDSQGV